MSSNFKLKLIVLTTVFGYALTQSFDSKFLKRSYNYDSILTYYKIINIDSNNHL